jgi:colanic acid biosynthesis glycosyl transferase WcaI
VDAAGGCVLAPDRTSIPAAADWVTEVLDDNDMWDKLGRRARELAEREFELTLCATKFEEILLSVAR